MMLGMLLLLMVMMIIIKTFLNNSWNTVSCCPKWMKDMAFGFRTVLQCGVVAHKAENIIGCISMRRNSEI